MIRRKTLGIFILLAALSIMLAGCWNKREIEERTSVVAIAIDRQDESPKPVKVSVQIPIPTRIAGSGTGQSGGGGGESVKVMSAGGRTLQDAFNQLQKKLNQQLFFGHTRVVAISEKTARHGVADITDALRREPQFRRLLWPLVVKGDAADLLTISPELEQIPAVYTMTMIENGVKTERIPAIDLGQFFIALSSRCEQPYLNCVKIEKNNLKWSGIAVFRGDRLVGTLNETDAWRLIQIRHEMAGGQILLPLDDDPSRLISLRPDSINTRRHFSEENGRITARFEVSGEVDVIETTFETDFSNPGEIRELEDQLNRSLETESRRMIEKLQREYKSDILGIGKKLKAYHPDMWRKINWSDEFPEAGIQIAYKFKLRRTGMEMK